MVSHYRIYVDEFVLPVPMMKLIVSFLQKEHTFTRGISVQTLEPLKIPTTALVRVIPSKNSMQRQLHPYKAPVFPT